jgi:5-epi-alpha-selinene synthase
MPVSASLSELTQRAVSKMQTRRVTRSTIERDMNLASLNWAKDKGMVADDLSEARLVGVECGSFATCSYPGGSAEMKRLCADFVAWLFLFDDRYCEAFDADAPGLRLFFREYETLMRAEDARPLTPYQNALCDIKERAILAHGADRRWVERFAVDLESYFEGCAQEAPFRKSGRFPNVSEYRALRLGTIGARPLFDLIELASGFLDDVPELSHETKSKSFVRAREAASLTFGWINDVFSYRKESRAGDPLNLVAVLENEYSLSAEEAFEAAVAVFRTELAVLEDESANLRDGGVSPALDRYLIGLEDWLHGNLAWSSTCPRYR